MVKHLGSTAWQTRIGRHRLNRSAVERGMALSILSIISLAWTASLTGAGMSAVVTADDERRLPDGTTVPTDAIEDPASFTSPGSLLGVPDGSSKRIVNASSTNGIPSAALSAYQRAATVINSADKGCNVPWQLIAAIGRVESDHGRYGGNSLGKDGVSRPGIYGIALDGSNNTQAIKDTDAGQFDNDVKFDRAVGPMQFIPSTWSVVGVDADGDAKRNPQDIDDSALAAGVYLCSGNDDLSTKAGQRTAVHRYNHSSSYVDLVLEIMNAYLDGDFTSVPNNTTSAVTFTPDYDYTPPTNVSDDLGNSNPDSLGDPSHDDLVSNASDSAGDTGTPGNHDTPAPTGGKTGDDGSDTVPGDSASEDPSKPRQGAGKKLKDSVKKAVEDTGTAVEDTLTKTEATTQCLGFGISKLDVVGMLNCVNRLLQR